jgi:hypothetical protein
VTIDISVTSKHLHPSSQSLARELYIIDSNVGVRRVQSHAAACDMPLTGPRKLLPCVAISFLDCSENADALRLSLHSAARARWDLSDDEHGRFTCMQVLFSAGTATFLTRVQRTPFQTPTSRGMDNGEPDSVRPTVMIDKVSGRDTLRHSGIVQNMSIGSNGESQTVSGPVRPTVR